MANEDAPSELSLNEDATRELSLNELDAVNGGVAPHGPHILKIIYLPGHEPSQLGVDD